MRVILYARPGTAAGASALGAAPDALAAGLTALGHSVAWRRPGVFTPDQLEPCDAVGVVGLQGGAGTVARAYRAAGVPVVIADLPRLRDTAAPMVGLYRDTLQWMPAGGDPARGATMDPGVLRDRRAETILLCGQLPDDAAHGMDARALAAWTDAARAQIAAVTDRPVVVRPHPLASPAPLPPLRDALATAAAVVTYNSGAGLEALLAGVPVVCDPSAHYAETAYGWDVLAGDGAAFVSTACRARLLARVALTQWTLAEIADGTALRVVLHGEVPESSVPVHLLPADDPTPAEPFSPAQEASFAAIRETTAKRTRTRRAR